MQQEKYRRAAAMIKEAEYVVVLTGAGISTESGIPDFRSKGGLWQEYDPMTLATTRAIYENYSLFHQFYSERLKALWDCKPHRGHDVLAAWEREGLLQAVITQNIDALHEKAGNKNIYEIHGNIMGIYCQQCKGESSVNAFLQKTSCQACGGPLRPGVVLFGEALPQKIWEGAMQEVERAHLLLVIGTSLQVSPVNQLPLLMAGRGRMILINQEPTPLDDSFHLIFKEKAGETLWRIQERIQE